MTTWKKLTQRDETARTPPRALDPPDEPAPPTVRDQDDWTNDTARRRAIDQAPRRARWIRRRAGWLRGRSP